MRLLCFLHCLGSFESSLDRSGIVSSVVSLLSCLLNSSLPLFFLLCIHMLSSILCQKHLSYVRLVTILLSNAPFCYVRNRSGSPPVSPLSCHDQRGFCCAALGAPHNLSNRVESTLTRFPCAQVQATECTRLSRQIARFFKVSIEQFLFIYKYLE